MPRSCWRARRTISRIRRSASCSSRPSSTRRAPGLLFSRRPRGRGRDAGRGLPRPRRRRPRLRRRRRMGDRPRAVPRPRPLARQSGRRSTAARCRARPARCSTRLRRLRERVRLAPGAFVRVTFATGVAPDRAAALALARKYRDGSAAARAFSMAFTHVHITLQHLGLSDEQAMLFDRLASRVFGVGRLVHQPRRSRRATRSASRTSGATASPAICRSCSCGSRESTALPLVRQLLQAQEYWRVKGLRADVVILNEHPAEYLDEIAGPPDGARAGAALGRLARQAGRHVPAARGRHARGRPPAALRGGARGRAAATWAISRRSWIVRRRGCMPAHDVPRSAELARAGAGRRRRCPCRRSSWRTALGGFTPDGREYVVVLDGERETPLPWSNVLANPEFGTIVSSSGSAFTWAGNSRENRLTPFANDPLTRSDRRSHLPARRRTRARCGAPRRRRCRAGRRRPLGRPSRGRRHALSARRRRARAGAGRLRRARRSGEAGGADADEHRRTVDGALSVFGYVEWCLGPPRAGERRFVVTEMDDGDRAHARAQRLQRRVRDRVAFWRATEPPRSYTGDRAEFVGRNRTLERAGGAVPRAARRADRRRARSVRRPAAHRRRSSPARSRRVAFVLGQGRDRAHARRAGRAVCRRSRRPTPRSRPSSACGTSTLGAVQVQHARTTRST